jgi:hypothetical protein
MMPIMTYAGDMDTVATPEQTAQVQRLFDDIGLDVRVTASYMAKSADVAEAVLFLGGLGMTQAFIAAAGSFSKALGGDLGHYAAERVTGC